MIDAFVTYGLQHDLGSLSATDSLDLQPETEVIRFETDPPSLRLAAYDDSRLTPFEREAVLQSTMSVSAPPLQLLDGRWYRFASWSDGGERTHLLTVQLDHPNLTAHYVLLHLPARGRPRARRADRVPLP